MLSKKAVVLHSGGMDSSICLALAARKYGKENILSFSFSYHQRHSPEIVQAASICKVWGIDHTVLNIDCLHEITENALTRHDIPIEHKPGQPPNTLVVGRNGLMAWLGSIHADHLKAEAIYMGIMEIEGANSGYRDCSRAYMDAVQAILRHDLDNPQFEIRTPLVRMTKPETMAIADELGILDFLIHETITCYQGQRHPGCTQCPSCKLRNAGIADYQKHKLCSSPASPAIVD